MGYKSKSDRRDDPTNNADSAKICICLSLKSVAYKKVTQDKVTDKYGWPKIPIKEW